MASNRGVVYVGPGKVEVRPIDFPKLSLGSRKCEHGVILKVVSTNICGSDQHMVRGRTTAPAGMVLGHEITGEIIEKGRDVEFLNVGDVVSVPFNIACGRCRNCREGKTGICLNVNGDRAGAAFGYVDMGGWVGGQADYVMAPYADFNLLKLSRQGPGSGEDRGPYTAFRHLPDGLRWSGKGGSHDWINGVRGRRRSGRACLCGCVPVAGRRGSDCRGHDSGTTGPGAKLRM